MVAAWFACFLYLAGPILMWLVQSGEVTLQGLSRLPVQEARCHYGGSPSPDEALSSGSSSNAFDD